MSLRKKQTKQKPLVELCGLCYNSNNDPAQGVKGYCFGSGFSFISFPPILFLPHLGQLHPSMYSVERYVVLSHLCLQSSHWYSYIFSIYFKERSTRSESIISSLTNKVKNVAESLKKMWPGIKRFLARMDENLSKNGLTPGQVLTGCVVILKEKLGNFMKLSLSTVGRCGVIYHLTERV